MTITIRAGRRDDAEFLGDTVINALGEDFCAELAGGFDRLPKVRELFHTLSAADDSQYSYRNALVAEDEKGTTVGAILGYDGGELHRLRKAFLREAKRIMGWQYIEEEMIDEASSDEVYLDSLYVKPAYRNQGIATALFLDAFQKMAVDGKPFGLLVEPSKTSARRLYERLGFKEAGVNYAFGAPMIHMQKT